MENLIIWIVLGTIALLFALPILFGFMLSAQQQVTRVELIKAPPTEVWESLNNLPAQTYWRSEIESVQMLDDDEGLRWLEHPRHGGSTILRKLKEIPQQELLLGLQCKGAQGTRHARLNAVPGGTRITLTEQQTIRSPWKRLRLRLRGGLDSSVDAFIQELKQKFTSPLPKSLDTAE